MHVVDTRGRVKSAGDAVIALMALSPKTRRKAWLVRALPPLRKKVRAQYQRTADRRSELSERVPDAAVTVVEPRWVHI
jgi:predicted DCC family thiol-disulfide oxidoreductase YuxK